jgi:parallel beta-helix repeat protein
LEGGFEMKKILSYALVGGALFYSSLSFAAGKTLNVPSEHKTIQAAIDAAANGDLIKVAAGRYKENIMLKEGIIIQGAGADVTTIDGGGKGNVVEGAKGAVIEGFTITNSGKQGITGTKMDVGISAAHSPMTIANCRIVGNNTGIRTYFSPSNIVNNIIADNKVYGLYILYSDSSIKNNVISDNASYGIYNSYSNPEIINNTILKNFDGIYSEVSRVVVRNNIVVNNNSAGIHWVEFPDAQNEKVAPVLSYNLVWGNKNDYVNVSQAKGDISRNPLLADISRRDLHLKKGSPAVNAGSDDRNDNDPDGTRNDMGAYGGPLSLKNIPSPTKGLSFASLKINLETLAEPDYSTHAVWKEGTSSGEGNFKEYCVTCHGALGKGDGLVGETLDIKPRDLSYAEYMQNLSDEHIFKVIKEGGASVGLSENMIPIGPDLSDEAIRNIIAYIRSNICKCRYVGEATVEKK